MDAAASVLPPTSTHFPGFRADEPYFVRLWHIVFSQTNAASTGGLPPDDQLFRQIDAMMPQLLAMSRRLSVDEEIAVDALQEALLKAAKNWAGFNERSTLKTWMTRIVINCVRDALRKRQRQIRGEVQLPESDSETLATCNTNNPLQHAIAAETRQRMQDAVGCLPDRQREVFALVVWDGQSADEVARLLDTSRQNVYANLHSAKKRLQETLSDLMPDSLKDRTGRVDSK
ncbi:MAG: sigma-70 family RNA polymerase sigma factor [Planctomycetota bacterium]